MKLATHLLLCGLALLPLGVAFFEILFVLGSVLALVAWARGCPFRMRGLGWAAACFLAIFLLSSLGGLDPAASLRQWSKLLYLCGALAVWQAPPSERSIALSFLGMGTFVALHCLVALGGWLLWGGEVRSEIDYLQLAQMATMSLSLVGSLAFLRSLPSAWRACALGLSSILMGHIVLSGSRAALLCLGLLGLGSLWRASRAAVLLLPPLVFCVYCALPGSRQERIRDALVVEARSWAPPSSLQMRLDMARTGWAIALEYPWLGVGLGNVEKVYAVFKTGCLKDDPPSSENGRPRQWPNLHDDYVQVLAEAGFLGLGGYLAFLGVLLCRPIPGGTLAYGIRMSLWVHVLSGLFYKSFLNLYPWRMFALLVALDGVRALHVDKPTLLLKDGVH